MLYLKKFNFIGLWVFLGCSIMGYAQEKPNILWITFEDTSPQFIGCYGDVDAETPVMDKMAKEGVRFTSAFSTGTVCSPSRSAIITGVPTYKMGSGNHRSDFPIPEFIKGFPEYLKDAGYYVSNNYKTDYNIAGIKTFVAETWNESSGRAGWWNRQEGQPFFAVFNIPDSHQSRTMSMSYEWYEENVLAYLKPEEKQELKEHREISNNVEIQLPSVKEFANLHEKRIISDSTFSMPPIYRDSKDMRKQMARVYNSIKLTDLKMGNLLQRLKEDGLLQETIVFIFADHGEGMPRAKTNGIGLGYRVPFIIWFPEKYKHLSPWGTGGVVSDELVDFEDLAPSILNLAGVEVPEYMRGRSLLKKNREPAPDFTYLSSDRADNGPDMVRTITDGRYIYSRNFMPFFPEVKYIRYIDMGKITQLMREDYDAGKLNDLQESIFKQRSAEVLYDIKADPWETKNLAYEPQYEKLIEKMRERLEKKIMEERDVHFLPEYELGEISKTTTPYKYRLNEEEYPLGNIFKTANLVGKSGKKIEAQLFQALKNENEFIRYWASLGLYSINSSLSQKSISKVKESLYDVYAPVQINLAAVLYSINEDKQAEEILKKFILSQNEHLALSAINYTLYLKKRSAFIAEIKEVYNSEIGYKVKAAAEDFLNLEAKLEKIKTEKG
ncbi:sulfatase [Christiangramia marina]|uniref:sulfatase family protein n=1 Tax=Christiangramia marina TaxID=409436 RepID=UPI003AA82945